MKKRIFLFAALLALVSMPTWAGGDDDTPETYVPTARYGNFVRHFHIDKAWNPRHYGDEANQTEPELVDCPGMIAWSIITWHDANGITQDYEMNKFMYGLTYTNWGMYYGIVNLEFDVKEATADNIMTVYQEESNVKTISNSASCTYWVYKRFNNNKTEYNKGAAPGGDSYQESFFNTKLSQGMINFINEHPSDLELYYTADWQNTKGSDNTTHIVKSCSVLADDKARHSFSQVELSNLQYKNQDNKSQVQFNIAKNNYGLYLQFWKGSSCISTVDAGTGKSGSYALDASSVDANGLENGNYFVRSSPYVRLDTTYYRKNHGCPIKIEGNSYYKDFAAPAVQQARNVRAVDQHDGTVKVTWNINAQASGKTYDNTSGWVLERAKSADFTKEYFQTTIGFASSTRNYEYIDQVSERSKGKLTYYYRLSRACLNPLYPKTEFQSDVNSNFLQVNALSATQNGQNVDVSWTEVPGIWSVKNSLELTYHTGDIQKNVTLKEGQCKYTVTDLKSCFPTEFKVQVKDQGTVVSDATIGFMLRTGDRELTSLSVSKGIYNDRVRVCWKVNPNKQDFTYYVLKRKLHQADDSHYEPLTNINHTKGVVQYSFYDHNVTPGVYYDYCVEGIVECDEEISSGGSMVDIGFAQSYGVVSGQVTYSGNQAVKDVSVAAIGNDESVNRALYFSGNNSSLICPDNYAMQLLSKQEGAVEFFYKLDGAVTHKERYILLNWGYNFSVSILENETIRVHMRYHPKTSTYQMTDVNPKLVPNYQEGEYMHVAVSYRLNDKVLETYVYLNGYRMAKNTLTLKDDEFLFPVNDGKTGFVFGDFNYKGWLDEIRFWNVYRDSADIAGTYNRYLTGSEKGLTAYYRCDDDVAGKLFDMSQSNGVPNEHHLVNMGIVTDRNNVPTKEQLALKGVTDEKGNYLINAIPYTASGSQYQIVPMKGVHEFSPNSCPLFFNAGSSTHNGVNFTDESSFEVRGIVTYEGTTFPVVGCSLYVDDVICTNNNEPIYTGEDGTFVIHVPIGKHAITIKKEGHTFLNGGRFPANKNALYDFAEPMNGVDFVDDTKVVLTGRVVGGDMEGNKAHGMHLSKNNIGTAVITLGTESGYCFNTDTHQVRTFAIPSEASVLSLTQTGKSGDAATKITIRTDSTTGEFSVLLPPIDMTVKSIKIGSSPEYTDALDKESYSTVDLGSANISETTTDSAVIDGNHFGFTYLRALDIVHHAKPVMKITQLGAEGNEFGERYEYMTNIEGKIDTIPLYTLDSAKQATYTYDYPIFLQNQSYAGTIHAYEPYYNYDKDPLGVLDRMPFANAIVTVKNELGQKVVAEKDTVIQDSTFVQGSIIALDDNQMMLDSTGHATYQFVAGEPNILNNHTLGMTITYTDALKTRTYSYDNPIRGIVFGGINSGSNVVTEGPDMLSYILRDPLGGKSFATLEEGSTILLSRDMEYNFTNQFGNTENIFGGVKIEFSTGMGVEVVNTTEMIATVIRTAERSNELHTTYRTFERLSTNHSISTADNNLFVGSMADVFVGKSTNMLFGNMRTVGLVRDGDAYIIGTDTKMSAGQSFKTDFVYSQWYIENELIPNYYKLRNSLLEVVDEAQYESLDSTCNTTDDLMYITTLQKTDSHFGDSATYRIIYPKNWKENGKSAYLDKVQHYNTQVKIWKQQLAFNEEAKVKAIQDKSFLINNVSFDGIDKQVFSTTLTEGTELAHSTTANESISWLGETGATINEFGMSIETSTQQIKELLQGNSATRQTHTTLSYTLQGNELEMLSMDVLADPYGFGPIFSVRGGQTYCPYEDEEKTRYYEPGEHVLNTQTVNAAQVELSAQSYALTDVPMGMAAKFTLSISNLSDISSTVPMPFTLYAIEKTNPDGALVYMDGADLNNNGITLFLAPMQTIQKTLYIAQGSDDQIDFNNIGIGLAPECMLYRSADTIYLSAHFVPSCTPVELKISNRVLNSESDTVVHFSITGYDKNFKNLQSINLEYRSGSDNKWTKAQTWVVDPAKENATNSLLPGGRIDGSFSLRKVNFTDGTYQFRVVSQCQYGNETIDNESEIIEVVRDVTKPQALGQPSPVNGIYTNDNEIYVLMNEPIQTAKVSSANIHVTGMLNAHDVSSHDVAFHYSDPVHGYTESQVYVSSEAFSLETWLRYQKAGVVFYHGKKDGLWVEINAQGRLEVGTPTGSVESNIQVPKDEWCFLLMNMAHLTDTTSLVSLYLGTSSTNYQYQFHIPSYSKTAPIFVGYEGEGDMHDLMLTATVRTWATAYAERNLSKDLYTDAIGYWPMNEGNGKVAKDQLRHRHLVLSGDSWWRNGVNYAKHITSADTIPVNNYTTKDYAIEMWLRKDADGEIFRTSDNSMIFSIREGKYILAMPHDTITKTAQVSLADGGWHQLTFLGNKSGKSVCIVDGHRVEIAHAELLPNMLSKALVFGASDPIDLDELRVWNSDMSESWLELNRYTQLGEDALTQYKNRLAVYHSMNDIPEANRATSAAPLCQARVQSKVNHTFTTANQVVLINITEPAYRIEGCTLEFCVEGLIDVNGNYCTPITWTAYVNRNQLLWGNREVFVAKENLQEVEFPIDIVNNSGQVENWQVTNIPEWLTFSDTSGTVQPLSVNHLQATVDPSLAIGTYEHVVYLTGSQSIHEPLFLNVKVTGDEPNWTIRPSDYEYNMNLIGVATLNGFAIDDEEDKIAAFVNGQLAGVASPKYNKTYFQFFVMMDIYANLTKNQKDALNHGQSIDLPITFKLWDASTGLVYSPLQAQIDGEQTVLKFSPNTLAGTVVSPVVLAAGNKVEQSIALEKGWNWISFNVMDENVPMNEFLSNFVSDITIIKSQTEYAQVDSVRQLLIGSLNTMDAIKSYHTNSSKDTTDVVVGYPVNPIMAGISLERNRWTWIGYIPQMSLSVNAALANLSPTVGDIVKGRNGFATWDGAQWIGSLSAMVPGQGYMYYNASSQNQTLYYPTSNAIVSYSPSRRLASSASGQFTPVAPGTYQNNMTITARVMDGEQVVTDAEVGVFAGQECRAAATAVEGLYFLTVPGDQAVVLNFKVARGSAVLEPEQGVTYMTDAVIGDLYAPYIIQIGEDTGLQNASAGQGQNGAYKVIIHNHVYIVRDGKMTSILGQEVKDCRL